MSNPLSHPVPRLSLTWQDGHWVKEVAMGASLRGTTEPSTWFRCSFSLGFCRRPARRADCYGFVLPSADHA